MPADQLVTAFVSDHGEGFDAARGRVHHGARLHDDLLHVPLVLRAPGINCERETAHAFTVVGATPEVHHVNRLLENPALLRDYRILVIPGGFSYGDDVAAGRILANQIRLRLASQLEAFHAAGKV